MRVDIEEIIEILKRRREINTTKLKNIELYKDNKQFKINEDYITKFQLAGLSNIDIITMYLNDIKTNNNK